MAGILMRMIVGVAALWLIAAAYQTVMGHMAKDAVASAADSETPPAFQFKRTDLGNCEVAMNGPPNSGPRGCGEGATFGDGAIPPD